MFFQHSKRNFVSLRGHVIRFIYSSSKLKTKLEVISRYLEVTPVSFREIPETSRKVTNLRVPWVAVVQLANPST